MLLPCSLRMARDQLLLGHGAAQAAQRAFDLAQVTEFSRPASYIANRNINIAIANFVKNSIWRFFLGYAA